MQDPTSSSVCSTFQAEAQDLSLAMELAHFLGWTHATFYSDNKALVQVMTTDDLLGCLSPID
jgi:ribonuclease HI